MGLIAENVQDVIKAHFCKKNMFSIVYWLEAEIDSYNYASYLPFPVKGVDFTNVLFFSISYHLLENV